MNSSVDRAYCMNCQCETPLERFTRSEDLIVRGEPIMVEVEYHKCGKCGDEVLNPSSEVDPFDFAYREYRRHHSLLQPEEIRDWRRSLDLTQRELAKLLGLGIATINRYEKGALQGEAHEKMIRMAMEPSNLMRLIQTSEGVLTEDRKRRILEILKEFEAGWRSIDNVIMVHLGSYDPSELNGYMGLHLQKLYNAILFFAKDGVLKSKLNKLLFYGDFKYFKEYTLSITGLEYVHLPYGPVPNNYAMYYASLFSRGAVEFVEETYPTGYVGEVIKSAKEPDLNVFSAGELRVLASVKEYFQSHTAKQMTDFSHREKAYLQTSNREIVSYRYASQLNF